MYHYLKCVNIVNGSTLLTLYKNKYVKALV